MLIPWMIVLKVSIVLLAVAIVLALVGYAVMYIWVKIRSGSDYDYNIFEDTRMTKINKRFGSVEFSIPSELQNVVRNITTRNKNREKKKQTRIEQPPGQFIALLLNTYLGKVYSNIFFEIEIMENPYDSDVYVGLWEQSNFVTDRLPSTAETTIIWNGTTGVVSAGSKSRKFNFTMRNFGDVGGVLLYRDPNDNSGNVEVIPTCYGGFSSNMDEPDDLKTNFDDIKSDGELNRKELTKAEVKKLEKEK
jgi:hypothetical protein